MDWKIGTPLSYAHPHSTPHSTPTFHTFTQSTLFWNFPSVMGLNVKKLSCQVRVLKISFSSANRAVWFWGRG